VVGLRGADVAPREPRDQQAHHRHEGDDGDELQQLHQRPGVTEKPAPGANVCTLGGMA